MTLKKFSALLIAMMVCFISLSACYADTVTPPTKPNGEQPMGTPPAGNGLQTPPDAQGGEQGTPPQTPDGSQMMAPPDGMGSVQNMDLNGVYIVDGTTETGTEQRYSSSNADENAILVRNGGSLTLGNAAIDKAGDTSSADNSNFFGLNAALAVQTGSSAILSNLTLTTTAEGANAVFSTGEGAQITISGSTIKTTGDSARGLDATYGGTIIASDMTIETTGAHCAPIATDRGEGTITVDNATLKAQGDGSPCVYSTGAITLHHVSGIATGSQACVIEGKNTITMTDSDLTGAGLNGVMLYQSTSGDAGEGTSVLTSTDSELSTTGSGPMFYVTNTDAKINLVNTALNFSSGILIKAAGNNTNNWGVPGSNGGKLELYASNQSLIGLIVCDEISTVSVTLDDGTVFEGAIDAENTGACTLNIMKGAVFTLTADSYLDSITCSGTLNLNGHSIYLSDGTIMK